MWCTATNNATVLFHKTCFQGQPESPMKANLAKHCADFLIEILECHIFVDWS